MPKGDNINENKLTYESKSIIIEKESKSESTNMI